MSQVLVTGGAGYIGVPLCRELLEAGWSVRALDVLLHGQEDMAQLLEADGVEVIRGDLRDDDLRARALAGVDAVVHLAAIVGDPACAVDPAESNDVNVVGTAKLVAGAAAAGVGRFVFASTCSNYGRMADPTVPITEEGTLAPVSLYAEQKVAMEQALLGEQGAGMTATCLRFATVYGVAPRMRFDLTVNEFTRDLWADRRLEVFGQQFWRPYAHVRDVGRGVVNVLGQPEDLVRGAVFNVGRSGENYRKLDLIDVIRQRIDSGEVVFVERSEDPRDYKVSFDKIKEQLGFETLMTVPDGISELLVALDEGQFPDPYEQRYRNV
jgi:nucleoside-diphosphate-sugar epimerase